jgi:hypothetical protein
MVRVGLKSLRICSFLALYAGRRKEPRIHVWFMDRLATNATPPTGAPEREPLIQRFGADGGWRAAAMVLVGSRRSFSSSCS